MSTTQNNPSRCVSKNGVKLQRNNKVLILAFANTPLTDFAIPFYHGFVHKVVFRKITEYLYVVQITTHAMKRNSLVVTLRCAEKKFHYSINCIEAQEDTLDFAFFSHYIEIHE